MTTITEEGSNLSSSVAHQVFSEDNPSVMVVMEMDGFKPLQSRWNTGDAFGDGEVSM